MVCAGGSATNTDPGGCPGGPDPPPPPFFFEKILSISNTNCHELDPPFFEENSAGPPSYKIPGSAPATYTNHMLPTANLKSIGKARFG